MAESAASAGPPSAALFARLFSSRAVASSDAKSAAAAEAKLQDALDELEALQRAFVDQQTQQNLLEKLASAQSLEELRRAAAVTPQLRTAHSKAHIQLQAAVKERVAAFRRVELLVLQVEQQKKKVVEYERGRAAHVAELASLGDQWKELQKQNAQRKAKLQVATGLMINDEEDCERVLDQQTQSIRELQQKKALLEDKSMDISTKVKKTNEGIARLTKQNDARSKDVEVKQREQEYLALQHMKDWYDQMNEIQASLSGIKISSVNEEGMEIDVLGHLVMAYFERDSMRLERVEFQSALVKTDDLVEVALRDNSIQHLLGAYRARLLAMRTP